MANSRQAGALRMPRLPGPSHSRHNVKTLPSALLRPSILTFVIVLCRKSVLVTASCVLLLQPDLLTAGIGQTQEFTHAGPAGRFGATGELSGDGFNGGDGVQHEKDRVWERWGDQAQPSPTKDFPLFKGSVEYVRTNSLRDRELCWRAVADTNHGATMPLRPLAPEVLLPDGTPFLTWEQPASHRRTFFVDASHADASDENPGSEDKPWKTISQAAAVLEPGDRVLVKKGVYREWVRPARGGTGPDAMIGYEADGDGVIIRGSEPVVGEWQPSSFDGKAVPGSWMTELPDAMFEDPHYGNYNPFRLANLMPAYGAEPHAVSRHASRPGYGAPRGMVFHEGRRLQRADALTALRPGSYFVEAGDTVMLHVSPPDGRRPEPGSVEVTVRPYGFAPVVSGLGFIRVKGFTVERIAHRLPIPIEGAIDTMQGHHWIIENNTVQEINGIGLSYGRRKSFVPREVVPDEPIMGGIGHIIRGNRFVHVGVTSMMGIGLIGGLVEDNHAEGTGWLQLFVTENAGYKAHFLRHCLLRRNSVVNSHNDGFWIDHTNINLRFTENIAINSGRAGIYLEASYEPVLIDNNISWGHGASGALTLWGSSNATIANNLFANADITKDVGSLLRKDSRTIWRNSRMGNLSPISIFDQSNRGLFHEVNAIDKTRATGRSEALRISGNIFYNFGGTLPEFRIDKGAWAKDAVVADHNLWVDPPGAQAFPFKEWQEASCAALLQTSSDTPNEDLDEPTQKAMNAKSSAGESAAYERPQDPNGKHIVATINLALSPGQVSLTFDPALPALEMPRLPQITRDIVGAPRSGATTMAGPFQALTQEITIQTSSAP